MANAKSPGGRGASRGPRKPSEAVCTPAITFPLEWAKPRQIEPQECTVRVLAASADGIRLQVLPREASVRDILNATYGPPAWSDRYYFCGGVTHCQIGILSPVTGEHVYKDAGPMALPTTDTARMQENTSFLRAASKWGIAEDVMELKPIALKSAQVPVMQDAKGGYHPAVKLTVDRFARDEAGAITMVQFALSDGKKVLWPEKA